MKPFVAMSLSLTSSFLAMGLMAISTLTHCAQPTAIRGHTDTEIVSTIAISGDQNLLVQEAFRLTNKARQEKGLSPLRLQPALAQAAQQHSHWMAAHQEVSHGKKDTKRRLKRFDYEARAWRENVMGPGPGNQVLAADALSPKAAIEAWLKSPGHRRNLLDAKVTDVGFGYYGGYWTQVLAAPAPPLSSLIIQEW